MCQQIMMKLKICQKIIKINKQENILIIIKSSLRNKILIKQMVQIKKEQMKQKKIKIILILILSLRLTRTLYVK